MIGFTTNIKKMTMVDILRIVFVMNIVLLKEASSLKCHKCTGTDKSSCGEKQTEEECTGDSSCVTKITGGKFSRLCGERECKSNCVTNCQATCCYEDLCNRSGFNGTKSSFSSSESKSVTKTVVSNTSSTSTESNSTTYSSVTITTTNAAMSQYGKFICLIPGIMMIAFTLY